MIRELIAEFLPNIYAVELGDPDVGGRQPGRVGDAGQGGVGGGVRAARRPCAPAGARTAPGSGSSGDHVYSHPAWPGQRQGLAGLLAG